MVQRPRPKPESADGMRLPEKRAAGPGRPKDLGKRAAILAAAKRLFVAQGFAGVSMDQIAADAGVSKLTVYSHFGDKEALFAAAVQAHFEQQLPESLFAAADAAPLHDGLMQIARAFFAMIMDPDALAGHRIMCTPQMVETDMPQRAWEVGPQRAIDMVADVLRHHVDAGELDIDDVPRAASQFLCLVKGDLHQRVVFGCAAAPLADEAEAQLEGAVDMFLRAYGTARTRG
ncbi:TetR/AcrR family transcriptional regulator [Lysobacter sp. A6]|uniref:TetR/AcrR family transcriptional regulator n=1 Tax=Noviluteimonas lactosilytica TaxID=2888523 RepID=A0ABS8JLD6_9GAMM|nr:TetR/AcrR family transcriptional regulator [Lysobacter lactosilyticus]MCC8364435.1 TetR/AcrR family transcriptional regulator [Lysobacter lactosilyticus]